MSNPKASDGVGIQSTSGSSTSLQLVDRMPSPHLVAKIGIKKATPQSLAARMPSPEIGAKVGIVDVINRQARRVQRRNAV